MGLWISLLLYGTQVSGLYPRLVISAHTCIDTLVCFDIHCDSILCRYLGKDDSCVYTSDLEELQCGQRYYKVCTSARKFVQYDSGSEKSIKHQIVPDNEYMYS